jgi:hypothetical protein
VDRPPSGSAASLTGAVFGLGLGAACLTAWSRSGRVATQQAAQTTALEFSAIVLGALLVVLATAVVVAKLGDSMHGAAAFRYPDPLGGVLLGGGIGLAVSGAVAVAGAAIVAPGAPVLAAAAVILGVSSDTIRRALPVVQEIRRNSRLAQGSSPFRAT